jgi:hypothetical protein
VLDLIREEAALRIARSNCEAMSFSGVLIAIKGSTYY